MLKGSLAALAALAAALAAPPAARAGDEQGAIAVLPFTSSESKLEMYGVPVSRALAVELRGAAAAPVQSVSDPTSLPRRIAWVIDGRILQRGGGKVALEARLRDPDLGRAAGLVATGARPLRQIDRLARELAGQLLPVLEGARGARKREIDRRVSLGVAKAAPSPPEPRPAGGPRSVLIGRTGGGDSHSGIAADPMATSSAVDLAQGLGRRPQVMELSGIAPPDAVKAALVGAGASHALLTHVVAVDFMWYGVLTARGRVRVMLVDGAGKAVYDENIETDTVVGSRGDRQEALFGFVVRQALEIARPRLRRLLAP